MDRAENGMDPQTPVKGGMESGGWLCPGTCRFIWMSTQQTARPLHRGCGGAAGAEIWMGNVPYWLLELFWKVVEPVRRWGFLQEMSYWGVSWGLTAQLHFLSILCFLGVARTWPATSWSTPSPHALSTVPSLSPYLLYLNRLYPCLLSATSVCLFNQNNKKKKAVLDNLVRKYQSH